MKREYKYLTAASMLFALIVIVANGIGMPWNEEAFLYALYGGAVGFYLAIAVGMLAVWFIDKKHQDKK